MGFTIPTFPPNASIGVTLSEEMGVTDRRTDRQTIISIRFRFQQNLKNRQIVVDFSKLPFFNDVLDFGIPGSKVILICSGSTK